MPSNGFSQTRIRAPFLSTRFCNHKENGGLPEKEQIFSFQAMTEEKPPSGDLEHTGPGSPHLETVLSEKASGLDSAKATHLHRKAEFPDPSPKLIVAPCLSQPEPKPKTNKILLFCTAISICAVPLGWDMGSTGNLVDLPSFRARYTIPNSKIGIFVSLFNAGCIFGSLAVGQVNCRLFGFVKMFQCLWSTYFVGTVMQFIACFLGEKGLYLLLAGRFACGTAAGGMNVFGPVYICQVVLLAKIRNEGCLAIFGCVVCGTIFAANVVFAVLTYIPGDGGIICFSIQLSLAVAAGLLSFLLPDAPQYYLTSGKHAQFRPFLEKIMDGVTDELEFELSLQSLKETPLEAPVNVERKENKLKPTVKCCLLGVFQQMIGISFFFYYGKLFFEDIIKTPVPNMPMMLMSFVNLVGAFYVGYLFRRWRGKTVLAGGLVVLLCLLGIFTPLATVPKSPKIGVTVVMFVSVCGFIFVFSCTWGGGVGIMNQSMSKGDAVVISTAVLANWVMNTIVLLVTPVVTDKMGATVGYVFMGGGGFLALFVGIFLE